MRFYTALLTVLVILFNTTAYAEKNSHYAAAEKLLLLTSADKMLESMFQQMKQMQLQQLKKMDIPKDKFPVAEKYINQINDLMTREMSWDKIKDDMINMYTSVYTEKEIDEIIKFFESPIGRKFMEKMPVLGQKSMTFGQNQMYSLMPQIKKISQEMMVELKKK